MESADGKGFPKLSKIYYVLTESVLQDDGEAWGEDGDVVMGDDDDDVLGPPFHPTDMCLPEWSTGSWSHYPGHLTSLTLHPNWDQS